MDLTGIEERLLKILYEAPEMSGEIVTVLQQKGINFSLDQAQAIGEKLQARGYIEYAGSRAYADATLTKRGIDYVQNHS